MSGRRAEGNGAAPSDSDSDRPVTAASLPATATVRPSDDVRRRMDDIFTEMEQQGHSGRFRLPPKFVLSYKSDVMFLFVRAVVGYAVVFVKVVTLEKELRHTMRHRQLRVDQEVAVGSTSPLLSSADTVEECRQRLAATVELRSRCAFEMAAAYSRLVLHCSNFENHKEDERFFECVYLFACSVAKLSVSAVPAHWRQIEEELGFLFRGAQFSNTVKSHARTGSRVEVNANSPSSSGASNSSITGGTGAGSDSKQSTSRLAALGLNRSSVGGGGDLDAAGANPSASQPSTAVSSSSAFAKIQSLSPTAPGASPTRVDSSGVVSGGGSGSGSGSGVMSVTDAFELPKSRISSFPESVPVKKIVSELEATKSRAARNMEIAQAIRDQIATQRADEQRRRIDAMVSPRQIGRFDRGGGQLPVLASPSPPSAGSHSMSAARRALLSPRISMKTTFTTRSPALNHLLPTTEERVRIALEGYERELHERRQDLQVARQPPPSVGARRSSRESSAGSTHYHHASPSQSRSQSA